MHIRRPKNPPSLPVIAQLVRPLRPRPSLKRQRIPRPAPVVRTIFLAPPYLAHEPPAPDALQQRAVGHEAGGDEVHAWLDLCPDLQVDGCESGVGEGVEAEEGREADYGGDEVAGREVEG